MDGTSLRPVNRPFHPVWHISFDVVLVILEEPGRQSVVSVLSVFWQRSREIRKRGPVEMSTVLFVGKAVNRSVDWLFAWLWLLFFLHVGVRHLNHVRLGDLGQELTELELWDSQCYFKRLARGLCSLTE